MANTRYALHLKGFVGGADFDRNYVDYVLAQHVGKPVNVLIDSIGGSETAAAGMLIPIIPNIPIAEKDKEGGLASPNFGVASAFVEQARESTRLAQNVSRFLT